MKQSYIYIFDIAAMRFFLHLLFKTVSAHNRLSFSIRFLNELNRTNEQNSGHT